MMGITSRIERKKQLLAEDIRGFLESCKEGEEIQSKIGASRFIKIKCHNNEKHVIIISLWLYGASWGNGSISFFSGVLDRVIRANPKFNDWLVYKPRGSTVIFGFYKNQDHKEQLPLFTKSGQ